MDPDFQIFTTIRYDPQLTQVPASGPQHAGWNHENASALYMFDFHRARLLKAAKYWDWEPAIELLSSSQALDRLSKAVFDHLGTQPAEPVRIKILVSSEGQVTVQSGVTKPKALANLFPERLPPPDGPLSELDPKQSPAFTLLLDSVPTAPSAFTNFKTTRRPMYDAARQRARLALMDPKEVLVVSEGSGHVMEGTIFTPYFWRGGRWVTPPVRSRFSPGVGSGGQDGTTRRWALERGLAVEEDVLGSSLVQGEECWLSNGLQGFVFARVDLGSAA